MKKDYIPVSSDVTEQDEIKFVSDFWTIRWDDRKLSNELIDSVICREEYRIMSPYLHELGSGAKGTRIHFMLQTLLGFFVTRNYVAHMLMAVGQRL